jgi:hypothetical protein
MLRFENKGNMDDLGLKFLKIDDKRFDNGF